MTERDTRADEALDTAERVFAHYAKLHKDKETRDGDQKSALNRALALEIREAREALRTAPPQPTAAEAIQAIIDNYSIAGANLLCWLTPEERAFMPRMDRAWWKRRPSQREVEDWASDVACRATFAALNYAKKAALSVEEKPDAR